MSRLAGHTGEVNSVAWSPSGETLASASNDKTLMVWDATSGAQVTLIVDSFIFKLSSCSRFLCKIHITMKVCGGSRRQLSRLEGHTGGVNSVAWSPSGEKLASASSDMTVTVWDAESGGQVR